MAGARADADCAVLYPATSSRGAANAQNGAIPARVPMPRFAAPGVWAGSPGIRNSPPSVGIVGPSGGGPLGRGEAWLSSRARRGRLVAPASAVKTTVPVVGMDF